jgi:hypothetical protein
MQNVGRFLVGGLFTLLALSSFACSSDDNKGGGGSGGGASADYENNGPGVCPGKFRPANDTFCYDTCVGAAPCDNASKKPVDSCCVMINEPGKVSSDPYLKRTTNTKEYADPSGAPPNLKCFDPATYPAQPPAGGSSKTGSLKGILKVFANGGCTETDMDGVKIEVYTVKRTGDPATDGTLDQLVGAPLVIGTANAVVAEDVKNKCVDGTRYNREYEYPNVPMYTELVVKTTGTGWTPFYAYNVYISESDPDFDSASQSLDYTVRVIAEDDFATIPTVAIGSTITPGNAAIGGEVHDCDNIRLQNAQVDVSLGRKGLYYFNADEDNPLPDGSLKDSGTGVTALYSALDVPVTGADGTFARIAGTGLIQDGDKDKLVSLGYYDVRAYPDSVTSVSLRGLRPFQVP